MNPLSLERQLLLKDKSIKLSPNSPLIMGILNVTPDSFSDGRNGLKVEDYINNATKMINDGASIIDIGGESTRPGASIVSSEEEISRIIPVIKELRRRSDIIISVDTYKSEVAREALIEGADIINDISALGDDNMAKVVSEQKGGIVIMFNKRQVEDSTNEDIITTLNKELSRAIKHAISCGITEHSILIDPGIGFGTTREEDLRLVNGITEITTQTGFPTLIGVSRKRVCDYLLGGGTEPTNRDVVSTALSLKAVALGASIIRCHNVRMMKEALNGFMGEVSKI